MTQLDPTDQQITGQCESLMEQWQGVKLHPAILPDLQLLQADAREAGFELAVASGYRSFDRQLLIWNEKVQGRRAVLDESGEKLDTASLSESELLFALLHWSAIPGSSRHHWGTDLDIYDAAAIPKDYQLQLTDSEVINGGVFAPMHDWLDSQIEQQHSRGFYRPYDIPRCKGERGVAAERWHISHSPTSQPIEKALNYQRLYTFYQNDERILLKTAILDNFQEIYDSYICFNPLPEDGL